ncbi:hypothetical protein LJK87_26870 [Paenibacillus sp. P25]|nr:hypothetical protein LJK87_26870 [Paenibacillus sp. P25]
MKSLTALPRLLALIGLICVALTVYSPPAAASASETPRKLKITYNVDPPVTVVDNEFIYWYADPVPIKVEIIGTQFRITPLDEVSTPYMSSTFRGVSITPDGHFSEPLSFNSLVDYYVYGTRSCRLDVELIDPRPSSPIDPSEVTIVNNPQGISDTITVKGVEPEDLVYIYDSTGRSLAFESPADAGQTSVTASVYQLGSNAGYVYLSRTSPGRPESTKVAVPYSAEPVLDTAPPVTSYHFDPVRSANGGYVSGLSVTLTASDQGTGVLRTEYRINQSGSWTPYSAPFTISASTTRTLEWRSIDKAGKQEKTWLMDFEKGTLSQQK